MIRTIFLAVFFLGFKLGTANPRLPKDYYWKKLPNGLEVVVIENNKVPLATIEMAVKNGAYTEGPEYSGLSHLFEHMFFKANNEYPDQQKFIKRTEELGAIWNGTTNVERVNYYFTIPKDSLEAGLKFMNASIRFPIYRTEDMQKERPVVDGEFQRAESDPNFQLYHEIQKKLWGDLVTRKNPIGEHDVINTATPEKMMIIKDKYYHPNNSLLIICGNINHDNAFTVAEAIYGDWPYSGFDPHEKYPIPEFTPLTGTHYFVLEKSIAQTPLMSLAWQGPDTRNDSVATLAADVFSYVLSQNSSKLKQALVDKGLATYVDLSYFTQKHVGPITLSVQPNPNKLKECYQELLNQVSIMGNEDYFTDEQLETAKQTWRRSEIRQNEKPSSLASHLSFFWSSASLDYFTDYVPNMMKISREDIRNYVKKYIIGRPYVAGMIINPEMNSVSKPAEFFKAF